MNSQDSIHGEIDGILKAITYKVGCEITRLETQIIDLERQLALKSHGMLLPDRYVAKRYLLCDPRVSTQTDGHRHMQQSDVGNWVEAKDYDALNQYVLHLISYMKDPSKSMVDAGMEVIDNRDPHQTFTAMSSTLLRGEQ